MSRGEARLAHAATFLVGVTGLYYGWMRYLAQPEDPFAIVNHPWQPHLLAAHILLAPLLVFACALFWSDHVWKRVRSGFRARRTTGLWLFALFFVMVFSGYLIQTAVEEGWELLWIWVHGVSSCLWLAAYMVHQLAGRKRARRG